MKSKHHSILFSTLASAATLFLSNAHAADGTWAIDDNGLWSIPENWSPGIADGSSSTANFTNDITADRTVSLDSARTLNSLVFSDAATATPGSWIIDNNGTAANTLTLAGTAPTITVNALGTNKTATISAKVEGAAFVKDGVGILALTGGYTGGTVTVNGGILAVNSPGGDGFNPTGGSVVINNGGTFRFQNSNRVQNAVVFTINTGGTLNLNGNSDTIGNVIGAGTITNTGGNAGITLADAVGSFSGAITGTMGIAKGGTGTWTLSGTNTYTGGTSISNGTLSASNIVVSGGSSHLGNATSAVNLGAASTQGTLSYTGNSATYTRGFNIGAGGGRLDVTTSGQLLTVATGNVTGSGLFTVGGAGNTDISSNLTHSGGLTKVDAGTLTLTGNSTYTGATNVSAGSLLLNGQLGTNVTSASLVTVGANGTFGGHGALFGDLSFDAASKLMVVNLANALSVTGTATFGSGFGIANLLGIDWDTLNLNSPYTLLSTTQIFDADDIANFGFDNRVAVGTGREAYFTSGSLQVVVIPEPRAALLAGLGLLALLRRRR